LLVIWCSTTWNSWILTLRVISCSSIASNCHGLSRPSRRNSSVRYWRSIGKQIVLSHLQRLLLKVVVRHDSLGTVGCSGCCHNSLIV
jgi:hypothetical protein